MRRKIYLISDNGLPIKHKQELGIFKYNWDIDQQNLRMESRTEKELPEKSISRV